MLHRRVEKFFDLGKRDDLIEFLANFPLRHAEDGAIEEDVLPSGKLGMETGADLEQTRNASPQQNPSLRWFRDTAQDLEQRTFPGAVTADDAQNLALLNLEAHIPERPEFLDLVPLHDLASANDIGRLAREVTNFAPDARRGGPCTCISLVLRRTGAQSNNVWTDFRQRSRFPTWLA